MKPLDEFIDDELTIPENTLKINEYCNEQAIEVGDLIRATVRFVTDAVAYVMSLTIDVADAVGALPDGPEATHAGGVAALEFYQAAALYTALRDRELAVEELEVE